MSNIFGIGRKSTAEIDLQVSEAWGRHLANQSADAVKQFTQLVNANPQHLDALFGLALALKKQGDLAAAREYFGRADAVCDAELAKDLEDPSRFAMMKRIIAQHFRMLGNA